jgi:hypothetical protein
MQYIPHNQTKSANGNQPAIEVEQTQSLMNQQLSDLLQQQQELNNTQDQLQAMLAGQQQQLEVLSLLYQQLVSGLEPPNYSPIQQQHERLLHDVQATDQSINSMLEQHQKINQEIQKILQVVERKETSMEDAIREQRDVISEHFSLKVMALQLGYLGFISACVSVGMMWLMPGGLLQTQERLQEIENRTLVIWSEQKKIQKFLGVPQK